MRRLRLLLLALVLLAQWAICGGMIGSRQLTLAEGHAYRFRTAPVDPYDPFQGRYVQLELDENPVAKPAELVLDRGQAVYVGVVARADDGFARFDRLSLTPPATGDYIRATVQYASQDSVRLELPFDRYYANEKLAPAIEQAYRAHSRRAKRDASIVVKIRGGQAVLEELYIGGLPVREFLRQQAGSAALN